MKTTALLRKSKTVFLCLLVTVTVLLLALPSNISVWADDWVSPTGHVDTDGNWEDEICAYDGNIETLAYNYYVAGDDFWGGFIEFSFSEITSNKLRMFLYIYSEGYPIDAVDVDNYDGTWHNVYSGAWAWGVWVEKSFTERAITKIRVRFHWQWYYHNAGYIYEAEIWEITNQAPVNNDAIIGNMDDTNNIYAQKPADYHINYTGYDDDGYINIDYILVNLTQGDTVRWCVKYDNTTDTFSEEAGSDEFFLYPASFASRSGIWINLTIYFMPEWDATEESDLEIKAVIVDSSSASDTDTLQTDYCDIVTNLLVDDFACDDDRGNLGQTITFTGRVAYADNPSSSTPSSSEPQGYEFWNVSVLDSGDNFKGTDDTVIFGEFEISFSAPSAVGIETYNLYIDMADSDYPDGEESPTDTFITDQIEIVSVAFDDSRVNVGASAEVRYVLRYDYDDVSFTGSDGSIVGFTWDSGNSWWDKAVTAPASPSSENYDENDLGALTESNYGLTGYEDDAGSDLIGDRLTITLSADDYTPDGLVTVNFTVTVEYEYDSSTCNSWEIDIWRNGTADWKNDLTNGSPDFTDSAADETYQYDVTQDVSESTYGITVFSDVDLITVTWGIFPYVPSNDGCVFTNLDDTDNLYVQLRTYIITYNGSDGNGYENITTVDITIQTGATVERLTIRYNQDTDTFSEVSGDTTKWTLVIGSCVDYSSGNDLDLEFHIRAEWDATEEYDLDLKAVITDFTSQSDTDTYDLNFDVVTNLVVSDFACSDDRGNVGASIDFTGTVYYANNPSSSAASTFYPPDSEFTAVHVYDEWDNDEGNDGTIVNGEFSVSVTANSTVSLNTYNPYLDMADTGYPDGEEAVYDTFIADRIVAFWEQLDDSRVDVDTNIEWRIKAVLDYDDIALESGDSITSSWGALTWDAGNSWFDISHSESSVGTVTITLTSGSETGYEITEFTKNITETSGIYDRIKILTLGANDTRTNINDYVLVYATAELEYDSHSLGSGDSLTIESLALSWNGTHFTASETKVSVQQKVYNEGTGSEVTYGITVVNMDGKSVAVIWDRLNIDFSVDDNILPLNNQSTFTVSITRAFDSSSVSSYSYDIERDGEGYENPHTTGTFTDVSSEEVIREYDFTSVVDYTYDLTAFLDPDNLIVVWTAGAGGVTEEYISSGGMLIVGSILGCIFVLGGAAVVLNRKEREIG